MDFNEGDVIQGKLFLSQYTCDKGVVRLLKEPITIDDFYVFEGLVVEWLYTETEQKKYSKIDNRIKNGFKVVSPDASHK